MERAVEPGGAAVGAGLQLRVEGMGPGVDGDDRLVVRGARRHRGRHLAGELFGVFDRQLGDRGAHLGEARGDGLRVHTGVSVPGKQHSVVAERQHPLVQGRVKRARHRPGSLAVAALEIGPRDPIGKKRVAPDQRAVLDQKSGHVGGVARQRQSAQGYRAERDLLAVAQRHGAIAVGDAPLERQLRQPQGGATEFGEGAIFSHLGHP
ncbi:MAG: hypothetical protein JJE35_12110 [Thermoleophilia bacterium]|nr:hypothetical protein [Thermoleophilia bacterium]